jgi:hypothetical protein
MWPFGIFSQFWYILPIKSGNPDPQPAYAWRPTNSKASSTRNPFLPLKQTRCGGGSVAKKRKKKTFFPLFIVVANTLQPGNVDLRIFPPTLMELPRKRRFLFPRTQP